MRGFLESCFFILLFFFRPLRNFFIAPAALHLNAQALSRGASKGIYKINFRPQCSMRFHAPRI
jgi:hypothetical protein